MAKGFFFIFVLFFISSCSSYHRGPASGASDKIDIIFDLDWTIVKQVDSIGSDPLKYIEVSGEFYRIGDGAVELLNYLFSQEQVRVSFFSGGKYDRNSKLLKKLNTSYGNAFDNAYKVLSYEDLLEVSTDLKLPFSERLKKDVSLVNENLKHVLIIDDDKRFIVKEQKSNLLWLGETYKHFEQFSDITDPLDQYSPKSRLTWNYDRKKLYIVKEILKTAFDSDDSFLRKVARESKRWNFEHNRPTVGNWQKLIINFSETSCSDVMINFLTP